MPRVTSKVETHRELRETLPNNQKVGINMFYGGIDVASIVMRFVLWMKAVM